MKKKFASIFILIFILTFSFFIEAAVEVGEPSHEFLEYYGAGAQLEGWFNISVENEDSTELFQDFFGNEITLLDLIKNTSGADYSCVPIDCKNNYIATVEEETKSFQASAGSSKLIGFNIDGKIEKINSIDFTLESDAMESCNNQLKMDFFLDGEYDFANNKSSQINCLSKSGYGCFDLSKTLKEYSISAMTPYCQKITLPELSKFELGAWIKRISGDSKLEMWLHNEYGDPISGANCELPKASLLGGEISCEITYLIKEPKDYFVCLTPASELEGESKIRGYADGDNLCGFHNFPANNMESSAAYQIFIEGRKFGKIGTIEIENIIGLEETLSSRMNDYLFEKYGESPITCPDEGCIVPIEIISSVNQNVELKNLIISYDETAGGVTTNKFFDIEESVSKVSTDGFQKFVMSNINFPVSDESEKIDYYLNFGSDNILEQEISIEAIPIIEGIYPSSTIIGYPTNFEIKVSSPRNISSYSIEFGDGKNITIKSNSTSHTYNESKSYPVTISVKDSNNRTASKILFVSVTTPDNFIKSVLNESQKNLEGINAEMEKYPDFYQESLRGALDLYFYESELKKYQKEFSQTFEDEKRLFELMNKILNFSTPSFISIEEEAEAIPFHARAENINLPFLIDAAGGSEPSNSQKYIEAISGWSQETLDMKLSYVKFSVGKDDELEHLISFFDITINKLETDSKDPWLIIEQTEGLTFSSKAIVDAKNTNYASAKLSKDVTNVLFSTTADVDFNTMPMFVSLPIDYIELGADLDNTVDPKKPKWIILILILVVLLLLGLGMYIFLQIWYKKKYEKHLFPNKTDLYNLISFVQSSRKKGINDNKIKKDLSASGWSGEKITYAMKKHSGKRTGMVELPINFGSKNENSGIADKNIKKNKSFMRPKTRTLPAKRMNLRNSLRKPGSMDISKQNIKDKSLKK